MPKPLALLFATLLGLLAALAASTHASAAAPQATPAAATPAPPTPAAAKAAPVTVWALPAFPMVHPGERLAIAVVLDHDGNWHTWPALSTPDVLPAAIAEFAIRTQITAQAAPQLDARVGPVRYPTPKPGQVGDPTGEQDSITVPLYAGRAIALVPLAIGPDAQPGPATVTITVTYQACDETKCLMPEDVTLDVALQVLAGARSAPVPQGAVSGLFEGVDDALFATLDAAPGGSPATTPQPAPSPSAAAPAAPAAPATPNASFFGLQFGGLIAGGGLAALALLSMLGGAILNLTPCVLPVIPIKVLTLQKHAGSPARAVQSALYMLVGVMIFWLGLGIPAATVSAFADPSRLFGIWWITVGLAVIIGLMALGMLGLFELTLPQRVYAVDARADSPLGSVVFGVMTAVLGLPCFGFVVGALLPAAATLGTAGTLTVFGGLGLGMGLPYVILAASPGLLKRMPKAGPGSLLIKQVMGLMLLGAAAYFLGAGLIALVQDHPYLAKRLHWWAVAAFGVAAGGWTVIRTFQISRKPAFRAAALALGLVVAGGGTLVALNVTEQGRVEYEKLQAAQAKAGDDSAGLVTGVWTDFSDARLARAREAGKVVVLDFTAEWCLNCKTLKATVLNVDPVRALIERDDTVMLKVDLTSRRAPGWEKLRALGQTGIPLLVIYGPGTPEPWLSNAYTADQVVSALNAARGPAPQPAAAAGVSTGAAIGGR